MMLNLIDALGGFENVGGGLVGMTAIALAVVGDAVRHAQPATGPDVNEPNE